MPDKQLSLTMPNSEDPKQPTEFVFDNKVRYVIMKGEPHWSIFDAYRIYGNSKNPRSDWLRDVKELEAQGFDIVSYVRQYQFFNEKVNRRSRPTPVANMRVFMRIAQVAKFKEWEPLRQKMADLMAAYIQHTVQQHPQWEGARTGEMMSHEMLMDKLEEAVWFICLGYHYDEAVETVFEGLYDRRRKQIAGQIGLSDYRKLEHYQSFYALSYQAIAKGLAAERLGERSELDFAEAKAIIQDTTALIAPQIKALSEIRGIDIATNIPLLAPGWEIEEIVPTQPENQPEPNYPLVAKDKDEYDEYWQYI